MLAYIYIKNLFLSFFKSDKYLKSGIIFKRDRKTNKLSIVSLDKYLYKRKLNKSDLLYRDIKIQEAHFLYSEKLTAAEISLVLDIHPSTVYKYIHVFNKRNSNQFTLNLGDCYYES